MWKFGGIEIERTRVGRICKLNFTLRPNVELPAWRILWTGHLPLVLLYQAGPSSIPISPLEDEISPSSRSSRHPCCCPETWWWGETWWQTWWQTQPLLWWGELSPSTISTTYLLSADHNQYFFSWTNQYHLGQPQGRPACADGSRPQRPPRGQRGPPTCEWVHSGQVPQNTCSYRYV